MIKQYYAIVAYQKYPNHIFSYGTHSGEGYETVPVYIDIDCKHYFKNLKFCVRSEDYNQND